MTRVNPNAMMFATVSGCAQTAVVRVEKPKAEPVKKSAGRSTSAIKKARSKASQGNAKRP